MKTTWNIITFSPTGGTKKVADAIAKGFDTPIRETDLTAASTDIFLGADEAILLAVPVYGDRVPPVVWERLSSLKGNGQKAVAVAVYGNRDYGDALLEAKDMLENKGFQVIAAGAFIAEHSIGRDTAAGRPNEKDKSLCLRFASEILKKIEAPAPIQVPGNYPYREMSPHLFHPFAGESCIACGLCADKCPVSAIPASDPKQTNNDACITCMRCVQICPVNARDLPQEVLIGGAKMLAEKASVYREPEIFI